MIAKRDTARGVCFTLVLGNGPVPPALALPQGFGLDSAGTTPLSSCLSRGNPAFAANQVGGYVLATSPGLPAFVDVDVTLGFPPGNPTGASTELLQAQAVDVQPGCP